MYQDEYFAKEVADKTWLIGCDCVNDLGVRTGKSLDFGPPTGNSWMIAGEEYAVLIDSAATLSGLRKFCEGVAKKPVRCILSHGHPDHIYHVGEFDEFWIHRDDMKLLTEEKINAFGFSKPEPLPEKVNDISEINEIDLGKNHILDVIHFPGHTDGSIMLYDRKTKLLFSGDSIARRLMYGTDTYIPLKEYIANLKRIRKMEISGICSCHDRCVLDAGQIDYMCETLLELPYATDRVQYTPEMEPIISLRKGNENEKDFFAYSFPEHLQQRMQDEFRKV